MKAITIPLSEYDIESFKELLCGIEDEIEWELRYSMLDTDETIKVKFVREEEEDEDDTDE